MIVIDERHKIEGVAERWKAQYFRNGEWYRGGVLGDCGLAYARLSALDPKTATAKEVAAIIGNNSWAGPDDCHECGKTVECTVQIGQPPDYESHTAQVCLDCLRKAVQLLESVSQRESKL